ncbi:nitrate reductase molybdenum cofactor assembly chaperone [Streptomyces sp. NBC_00076]|uniref:nitrate reductase molybdenum cofactor assembly chaperone n=1 Tax=Streptomyces sp. NBC_00076 TaxID=2975642 RepID=UPI003246D0C4
MPSDAVLYQAAALCLTYPDDDLRARLPLLREAAPQLREFTDHAAVTPAPELAAHYGRVFGVLGGLDMRNPHSLYLTWWRDEGTWRRGMALDRFREVFREHGLEFAGEELPDFLPSVLEFTARTGDTGLLTEHRGGLERLRARLTAFGTPYAAVLNAVCAALPTTPTGTTPP